MQSTHVGLYSSLPLSLNGPKGEGDQGGEGSPVGSGRIPFPVSFRGPARNLGRCPSPRCDINPLTVPEHTCYYPHRSNTTLTISRRNHNPGKPTRPTRGLNASAHPNGPRAGPRLKRKSPSPHSIGSRAPSPCPPGDGKTPWFAIVPCEAPNGEAAPSSGIVVG